MSLIRVFTKKAKITFKINLSMCSKFRTEVPPPSKKLFSETLV